MVEETANVTESRLDRENPWPGLEPFRENDHEYFRGRDYETDDLFRMVQRERIAVLYGLSGLGKSSLLQAGLFPLLRRDVIFPVYVRLEFSSTKRSLAQQVLDAILSQAKRSDVEAPRVRDAETLWEYFHRRGSNFFSKRNQPLIPLIVFDQAEELFTIGQTGEHSNHTRTFLRELTHLAQGSVPEVVEKRLSDDPKAADDFVFRLHNYKILIVLREDFLPEIDTLPPLTGARAQNRMRLRNMDGGSALLAVNQAPKLIDPDVAERVVRFVAAGDSNAELDKLKVEPALLSLVCRELNNQRLATERLTGRPQKITATLLEGSQEEILKRFYERGSGRYRPQSSGLH